MKIRKMSPDNYVAASFTKYTTPATFAIRAQVGISGVGEETVKE